MATLGAGLARGLAGFMDGRYERDRQRFVMDQQAAQMARQERLDEENRQRQAEMMRIQAETLKAQQAERDRVAQRQTMLDQRDAYEGGYRSLPETREQGAALGTAAAGIQTAPSAPMLGAAGVGLGEYADAMRSAREAYTLNGTPMAKTAESVQERRDRLAAQQREGEQIAARQARTEERAADQTFQLERDRRNNAAQLAAVNARVANMGQPSTPRLRVVPAGTTQDFQGIQSNLRELLDIENILTTKPAAASEALGLKNMLPEWAATRGMSDDAMALRGKLSNVTSGIFLERSGAAVTPSEAKRLEGWTANLTDNPKKALNAIKNIRAFYEQKARDMAAAYGPESGYFPVGGATAPDVRRDAASTTTVRNPYRD